MGSFLAALVMTALPFHIPELLWNVIKRVAGITTTISFNSLGVSPDMKHALANRRPLLFGLALRMMAVPLVLLSLSVVLGFRNQSLCGLMVLFAAPTAVISYSMAVALGADPKPMNIAFGYENTLRNRA